MAKATHLECSLCGAKYDAAAVANLCTCGGPLLVRYDLGVIRHRWPRREVASGPSNMWRYAPVLPAAEASVVTLGEGWTPLVRTRRLGARIGAQQLWVKDEGLNPTASFKARGMTTAITMAGELGIRKIAIPSAGNAASAAAAYAAAAGMEAHIFMPKDVPQANYIECKTLGAKVTLVDGLISDCARIVGERKDAEGWFDMSTLKEPYRVEGKKTMGYELAEQLNWQLPDVVLYPTGGGTGLIGMWKAFDEMERLGWIGKKRPRMFAVEATGCAPIVRAFEAGEKIAAEFPDARTVAAGLRVPKAIGDFLILNILCQSNGGAIAVTDEEMIRSAREVGSTQGLFVCPEGGACFAALKLLFHAGKIAPGEHVVIFNTGSGIKYLECYEHGGISPEGLRV